jgi:8-oxo-dGTP pyrophosphatase MutT (NUDIX family)
MTNYVVGLLFNRTKDRIYLIRKRRPSWQAGKLNGFGGHIEPSDASPLDAMDRETHEETGLQPGHTNWHPTVTLIGVSPKAEDEYCIHFFAGFLFSNFIEPESRTDEKIEAHSVVHVVTREDLLQNLRWLIPLSLDPATKGDTRIVYPITIHEKVVGFEQRDFYPEARR